MWVPVFTLLCEQMFSFLLEQIPRNGNCWPSHSDWESICISEVDGRHQSVQRGCGIGWTVPSPQRLAKGLFYIGLRWGNLSFKGPKADVPSLEQVPRKPNGENSSLPLVPGTAEVALHQGHRRARMWVFALTPLPLRTGSPHPPCCTKH